MLHVQSPYFSDLRSCGRWCCRFQVFNQTGLVFNKWSPRSLMVTEQWTVSSEAERLSLLLSTGEQAAAVSSPDIDHKSISSSYWLAAHPERSFVPHGYWVWNWRLYCILGAGRFKHLPPSFSCVHFAYSFIHALSLPAEAVPRSLPQTASRSLIAQQLNYQLTSPTC